MASRKASIKRSTKETSVSVSVNLDGWEKQVSRLVLIFLIT